MPEGPCLRLATHDQAFHGDDVLACAILTKIFKNHQIIRTREPEILDLMDIVFDVGGVYDHSLRRYDHHMPNPPADTWGHMPSSAGLIWKHYAKAYLQAIGIPKLHEEEFGVINVAAAVERISLYRWIVPVDKQDNGMSNGPTPISEIVSALQPIDAQKSRQMYNSQFREAVSLVSHLFERACFHSAETYIKQARFAHMEYQLAGNRRIMICPITIPSITAIKIPSVHFVIYPVDDYDTGGERIMIRPMKDATGQAYRTPFPPETWGCTEEQLTELGYKGLSFVHHTGFVARAVSEAAAVVFCERILSS